MDENLLCQNCLEKVTQIQKNLKKSHFDEMIRSNTLSKLELGPSLTVVDFTPSSKKTIDLNTFLDRREKKLDTLRN